MIILSLMKKWIISGGVVEHSDPNKNET